MLSASWLKYWPVYSEMWNGSVFPSAWDVTVKHHLGFPNGDSMCWDSADVCAIALACLWTLAPNHIRARTLQVLMRTLMEFHHVHPHHVGSFSLVLKSLGIFFSNFIGSALLGLLIALLSALIHKHLRLYPYTEHLSAMYLDPTG